MEIFRLLIKKICFKKIPAAFRGLTAGDKYKKHANVPNKWSTFSIELIFDKKKWSSSSERPQNSLEEKNLQHSEC